MTERLSLRRLQLLYAPLQLRHHVGVAQGRHVPQRAALGDVTQQPAHDLARARLGQIVGPDDALRPRELADPLGDRLADPFDGRLVALQVALEGHERHDRLAGVLVVLADHGRLGDVRMGHDR